ncbi:UDP-N-acetylmuramyl pentapeptide phosphotransferase/UDP-N-acetylglucosamine-1-phosphate transferase [Caldisalinibacter kiritimatiensis]|uniref:UDP-N-acetylmuramyl pentapeptide phosphotransferase/UDP-N-acetylglucosamine-1-phosphate transferase n=1 Tax=Caldisalinibacter kiritimatiensis TaxID=1304284 RepID=R1AY97_9FIRM|nr:UDP-N-acetylmuramyl pentapeptide phosphotransferase/UDP-N-acetylglucosamine-1-phosphate transferase [Caldisalinibacter kiritimatiensis]EOD01657.1 UDP-N-acetylmuramyl pentapeptide phosphotransferase/UDP-N-acetylglucosamine-1-phosphate transferase [Caldisalinibacter kiritimatiensis]
MIFLIALLTSYLSIYGIISMINKESLNRSNHKKSLYQGIVVYIIFIILTFILIGVENIVIGITLGGLILFSICVFDTFKGIKNILIVIPAIIVCMLNIRIYGTTNPLTGQYFLFSYWIQYIITIIWLFVVMNIINMLNKINGLAPGIVSISSLTLFIVALVMEQPVSALVAVILSGTSLGLVRSRKYLDEHFIKNIEGVFLGFILGIIAVDGAFKSVTILSLIIPLFVISLPLLNKFNKLLKFVVSNKGKKNDNKDNTSLRLHIEFNDTQSSLFMYIVSICLSFASIIILLIHLKHS